MALSALLLSSCANDDLQNPAQDGAVVFTANLPQSFSRAIADGSNADHLSYAVYESGSDDVLFTSKNAGDPQASAFAGLQSTLTLNLAKGKTYDIIFWADKSNNTFYTFEPDQKSVSINYDGITSNDNDRDAFFEKTTITVTGAMNETVTLRRPFAQINFCASDVEAAKAANLELGSTAVKVSNAYSKLNLFTGEASEGSELTFAQAPRVDNTDYPGKVAEGSDEPAKTYAYLSMNYVLTGVAPLAEAADDVKQAEKEIIDCSLMVYDTTGKLINTVDVSNVPVQRNYRTNIYGALLTSTVDYTIKIEPDFYKEDYDVEYVSVATPGAFVSAIAEGSNVVVPAEASIDLIGQGPIELANEQRIKIEGTVNTERAQLSARGEGVTVYVEGPGKITSIGVEGATGNRPLNAFDGATLVVRNLEIETEQNNGGSCIFSENGNLDLENVTINCHNFAVGANGGTLIAKNCNINSDSNNREGAFSYTLSVGSGCQAVLEGGTLTGIQGGIAVQGEGSVVTIKGGVYSTVAHPQYGENVAFYPVYATDKGVAIIEGGDFIGAKNWVPNILTEGTSCLVAGDNDVNMPDGNFIIKGGRFSGKAYNTTEKKLCNLPEGYEYRPISVGSLIWEVKAIGQ